MSEFDDYQRAKAKAEEEAFFVKRLADVEANFQKAKAMAAAEKIQVEHAEEMKRRAQLEMADHLIKDSMGRVYKTRAEEKRKHQLNQERNQNPNWGTFS